MCLFCYVLQILGIFFIFSCSYIKSKEICILNRTVTGSTLCCANYYKDKNGDCNLCAPGYFGDTCEKMCPRGTFGEDCGGECKCTPEDCDHVTGCLRISQLVTTQAVTGYQEANLTETLISTSTTLIIGLPVSKIKNNKSATKSLTVKPQVSKISSTILYSSEIQTTSSSSDITRAGEFNSNYLLFGVGLLLAILLIVIIIQQRLRSKSAQRTVSRREIRNDIEGNVSNDSEGRPRDSDKKQYIRLDQDKGTCNKHVYQHAESEYQEIDQCLEMLDVSPRPKGGFQSKEEVSSENAYLENYLDPVISTEGITNISIDRQRHSYIEILDSDKIIFDVNINDQFHENTSKSSSSYDDVMAECSTVAPEVANGNDNTYLDVLF